ncbi:MAG: hypothetical protein HY075_07455, partial [Deltaproteobacteria bacterium]|nr:hypothetical protein [Deltaproteobacteria bacterium]
MPSIPLLISMPLAPSLSRAIGELNNEESFYVHMLPMDTDILRLAVAARPSALVLSIVDEQSYQQTFELLENLRRINTARGEQTRDPSVRLILIAEHWAVQLERWMEMGVHEFIPAPISKKALLYKINRHYMKALSGSATDVGDPFAASNEIIMVNDSQNDAAQPMQSFYIPGDLRGASDEPGVDRIIIHADGPLLGTGEIAWQPAPGGNTGFDDTWMAIIPGRGSETAGPTEALFFTGD